jgi:hypothetical protein
MIAARSVEDIDAGDFQFVLGEIHAARNTVLQPVFLWFHPKTDRIADSMARENPDPELEPVVPPSEGGLRLTYDAASAVNIHVEYDESRSWRPRERALPVSALRVERGAEGLEIATLDGSRRFPALAFFGPFLRNVAAGRFAMIAPQPHVPRITIDGLVLQRETWRYPARELGFAAVSGARERYIGALRFARGTGLPRRLFYRATGEVKPMLLDLESPASVEMLAAAARRAAEKEGEISLSEMLPLPEQCWLADSRGERYTCELRMVAVDRLGLQRGGITRR